MMNNQKKINTKRDFNHVYIVQSHCTWLYKNKKSILQVLQGFILLVLLCISHIKLERNVFIARYSNNTINPDGLLAVQVHLTLKKNSRYDRWNKNWHTQFGKYLKKNQNNIVICKYFQYNNNNTSGFFFIMIGRQKKHTSDLYSKKRLYTV